MGEPQQKEKFARGVHQHMRTRITIMQDCKITCTLRLFGMAAPVEIYIYRKIVPAEQLGWLAN